MTPKERAVLGPIPDTYTCSACGEVFAYGRQDEDAHAEAVQDFGMDGHDPRMAIICDDCYQDVMSWMSSADGE